MSPVQYGRIDLHIPDDIKKEAIARAKALNAGDPVFAGMPVLRIETIGEQLDDGKRTANPA